MVASSLLILASAGVVSTLVVMSCIRDIRAAKAWVAAHTVEVEVTRSGQNFKATCPDYRGMCGVGSTIASAQRDLYHKVADFERRKAKLAEHDIKTAV